MYQISGIGYSNLEIIVQFINLTNSHSSGRIMTCPVKNEEVYKNVL